jgi:hypothetical protein
MHTVVGKQNNWYNSKVWKEVIIAVSANLFRNIAIISRVDHGKTTREILPQVASTSLNNYEAN